MLPSCASFLASGPARIAAVFLHTLHHAIRIQVLMAPVVPSVHTMRQHLFPLVSGMLPQPPHPTPTPPNPNHPTPSPHSATTSMPCHHGA